MRLKDIVRRKYIRYYFYGGSSIIEVNGSCQLLEGWRGIDESIWWFGGGICGIVW